MVIQLHYKIKEKESNLCLTHLWSVQRLRGILSADYAEFLSSDYADYTDFFLVFFGGDKEMAEWDVSFAIAVA